MAKSEQVNIDLTAKDKASKVIDKVADQVDDLEKAEPEVEIGADDNASKVIDKVADQVKELTKGDTELVLKARVDDLRRELGKAEDSLKAVQEKGEDAEKAVEGIGGERRVGAIRDLTGPLGDVSSAVGDFGDSFIAAGEQIGVGLGLSSDGMSKLLGVLGPAGVAVGIAYSFWQTSKKGAEEAKARVDDWITALEEANGLLDEAARIRIGEAITPEQVDAFNRLGINLDDVVTLLRGGVVPEYDNAREKLADWQRVMDNGRPGERFQDTAKRILGLTEAQAEELVVVADATRTAIGAIEDEDTALQNANETYQERARFLGDNATATQRHKDKLQELNTTLDNYTNRVRNIPATRTTDVTVSTDDSELDAAGRKVDELDGRTARVTVDIANWASVQSRFRQIEAGEMAARSAPSTTNVTIHAPQGMRAAELVRAGERYARRNGGGRARR